MEMVTSNLQITDNMYNRNKGEYNYDFDNISVINALMGKYNNRLLATFTKADELDDLIEDITSKHNVLYGKIFALQVMQSDELVLTYNIEQGNVDSIPADTILLHRKKESNSLYTINALNELIKKLNGGVVDTSYKIDWQHYRNCILLTQHNELKQLNTKIHRIIEVE